MAISSSDVCLNVSRVAVVLLGLTLGGCSFDLGSFSLGPDKEATPKAPATPTAEISAENVRDAQGYAAQGQVLARSGKTDEALAQFEKALVLDPYNVQALSGRGLIHQGEKRHAEAIEDFAAVHGLVPQRADPLVARATSYLALDKVKEAASDLDEAVQSEPNNGNAWSMRGLAYERLGDKSKAAASYSRALAIRPRDDAARSGLARVGG
ncbi:tetratricopeptide repeat protein [Bradyrhizobium sp.]|uniref:tetratricopeptide repeat protein n=1 Tax=Bradyrhizobium sp. TaxID=376 RepID=UPI001D814B7C|nr:tetratricopeptide repeat protein [Bradyrhizobium sp.]MBI5320929.1 tetratricopeptide repeat protein [Bradyrhizobium sp.]